MGNKPKAQPYSVSALSVFSPADKLLAVVQRRLLGKSTLEISRVVFGAMGRSASSEAERARVLASAIDHGITTIDTAPLYDFGENERELGRALSGRRDEIELLSKVGLRWDGDHGDVLFDTGEGSQPRRVVRRDSRPASIRRDVEESLQRLRSDYLDLAQIHHPDPHVPIAESLGALDELVREGKILHFGFSNFDAALLRAAGEEAAAQPERAGAISDQLHYSLLERVADAEFIPEARRIGLGLLAYSPLEMGALSDRILQPGPHPVELVERSVAFRPNNADTVRAAVEEVISPISREKNVSASQICLAWLLHYEPIDAVIVGATTLDQVRANAEAASITLSPDEFDRIDRRFSGLILDRMEGYDMKTRLRQKLRRVAGRAKRALGLGAGTGTGTGR